MKILVIQQKMIGDVLISTIICENLKREFPNAQIDYLINSFTKPVVENNPFIDNLLILEEGKNSNFISLLCAIRKSKYSIVIDAYAKLGSSLFTFFSGAKLRIGYQNKGLPIAYNYKVVHHSKPKSTDGLAIERRENLFSHLMKFQKIDSKPKLYVTAKEKENALEKLKTHSVSIAQNAIIMVSILGSDENKTYPVHYLVALINTIAAMPNTTILFNYMPKQLDQAQEVYNQCSEKAKKVIVLDLIETDLRSFIGIMNNCNLIIGNDGGAINIAKALNKPTFTLFSPWIQKESWSIFEDGIQNKAVHLKDYLPEIFRSKSRKELKRNSEKYYVLFKPELFIKEFELFLLTHLK